MALTTLSFILSRLLYSHTCCSFGQTSGHPVIYWARRILSSLHVDTFLSGVTSCSGIIGMLYYFYIERFFIRDPSSFLELDKVVGVQTTFRDRDLELEMRRKFLVFLL